MFGKIKDRLKNIFEKAEDVIEESPDAIEEDVQISDSKKEESKTPPSPKDINKELKKEKKKEKKIKEESKEEKVTENKEKTSKKDKVVNIKKINKSEKDKLDPDGSTEIDMLEKAVKKAPGFFHKKEKKEESQEENEEKKQGFFSKIFHKKEKEESSEELPKIEESQEETAIPEPQIQEEQKKEIKEKLPEKIIEEHKKEEKEEIHEEIEKKEPVLERLEEEKGLFKKAFTKLKSKKITQEDFDKIWFELEMFLLEINIAYEIVEKINSKLQEELVDHSFNRFKLSEKIREVLENQIETVLNQRQADLLDEIKKIKSKNKEPVKILVLGVNGTGKTTTIAKIVNLFDKNNLKTVVAAADTYRAAATEQLEEHSKKLNFKLIVHKGGSDPAAVAFDAIEHAKAKNLDVVLIDTAGRMPNNSNLMNELQKIKRVSNSDISLFIGDSVSGNDLIDQIKLFDNGVEINGVVLTKVDTDEKPGSIVTTAYECEKPIYYLGTGQKYDDLVQFNAKEIAKKLFDTQDEE